MENFKETIKEHFFGYTNKINAKKCQFDYIKKHNLIHLYDRVLSYTKFLNEDSKFSLRCLCVIRGITELPKCYHCKKKHQRLVSCSKYDNKLIFTDCCSRSCSRNLNKTPIKRSKEYKEKISKRMKRTWELERDKMMKNHVTNQEHMTEKTIEILNSKSLLLEEFKKTDYHPQILAKNLGIYYGTVIIRLRKYNIYQFANKNSSKQENEIYDFIKSNYSGKILKNITPSWMKNKQELDIVLPDLKLAVEFDGLYWHSDKFKSTNYHNQKTDHCNKNDIQLLHIFENEWNNKKQIWKSVILNKLKKSKTIHARKCQIVDVHNYKDFLETNHLQGYSNSKIQYGLVYKNELISLMTFSKSRFNREYDFELVRFCNKIGTSVVGGSSRLFKHFLRNQNGSVVSYANRRWSNGDLYKILGFRFSHTSKPNYFYLKSGGIYSRHSFMKHKLENKLKYFDEKISERDNMKLNGYTRIYDCGNNVFVYNH